MPQPQRGRLTALLLEALRAALGAGATRAVLLKGSALKGDFFPGWSDFDLHVVVETGRVAMLGGRMPDLEPALALQAALGAIRPQDFGVSQIQLFLLDPGRYPPEWTPPVPGTFAVVQGALPPEFPLPDAGRVAAAARAFLSTLPGEADGFLARVCDKPDAALPGTVRAFGSLVKPAVHHAAVLLGGEPLAAWRGRLRDLLALVEPALRLEGALTGFYAEVGAWDEVRRDPARLRSLFRTGHGALHALAARAPA